MYAVRSVSVDEEVVGILMRYTTTFYIKNSRDEEGVI